MKNIRALLLAASYSALSTLVLGCPGPEPVSDAGGDAPTRDGGRCTTTSECDDGLFCNGDETCTGGTCVSGTPPDCDDDVTCTVDRCSEDRVRCESTPADVDGDGYGDADCVGGNDCDDADATTFPGNAEVCDDDGHDEDCDATTVGDRDVDGDGITSGECCNGSGSAMTCGDDCNDTLDSARPGATETCNGLDDDCDGMIDDGATTMRYLDMDRDGWGSGAAMSGCAGDPRLAPMGGDCDDTPVTGIARSPGQPEICDGVDNDCNDMTDDSPRAVDWYRDADGDGFGSASSGVTNSCTPVAGHSLLDTDCDDTNIQRSPAAVEICNGLDDDCNDRADYVVGPGDFEDDDGDLAPDLACGAPRGVDCDDADPATLAGSAEICDGRDNDCDDTVDEDATTAVYYRDHDRDGYGSDVGGALVACAAPAGYAVRGGDCDDTVPSRHPSAQERCNLTDDDCDGTADEAAANASCPALPGVASMACIAGDCEGIGCAAGHADCDGDRPSGCEVDLDLDPRNCGGCRNDCGDTSERHTFRCAGGTCAVTCGPLHADCDGLVSNGCEHVGAVCPTCTGGMATCGGDCADLTSDTRHCGACGRRCGAGGACIAGDCDEALVVATGFAHSCVLRRGGGIACWGDNAFGQLGVSFSSPTAVTVPIGPATDLSCGMNFCCALLVDGQIDCWGDDSSRELGTLTDLPFGAHNVFSVPGTLPPIRVVAGYRHALAITAAGDVFGWGDDTSGQLSGTPSPGVPLPLTTFPSPFVDVDARGVAAGAGWSCFPRRFFGAPRCLGSMPGTFATTSATPYTLPNDDPGYPDASFMAATAGADHVCFLLPNGVWCGGEDGFGELGRPAYPGGIALTPFPPFARAIGAAIRSTCVASATGVVWCSGLGDEGDLGSTSGSLVPIELPSPLRARALSTGAGRHFCAIDVVGRVWCWGSNVHGQSAPENPDPIASPALVPGL